MDYLQALIFSIVEGFTEFLPVSSTGHLILTAKLLAITQTDFVKSFEIIIQLGAILAVVVLYWKTIWGNKKAWKSLFFAFIPTVVIGGLLYKFIKNTLLGNEIVVLWALLIGGLVMIAIEVYYKARHAEFSSASSNLPAGKAGILKQVQDDNKGVISKIEDITPTSAMIIGLFQSISIIPGVSRAAATIIGAMLMGTDRKTAVEFSFLLAIPTMAAATGLDLVRANFYFTPSEWGILATGFMSSFVVALFAVKLFLKFIQNHTFIPFGIYRIILAHLFFFLILK